MNPSRATRAFHMASAIFHLCSKFHKSRQGFISLKKYPCGRPGFSAKNMAFAPQSDGLRPESHGTLPRAKKVSTGHFFARPAGGPLSSSPIIHPMKKAPLRVPFPVNLPGGSFRGKDVFCTSYDGTCLRLLRAAVYVPWDSPTA